MSSISRTGTQGAEICARARRDAPQSPLKGKTREKQGLGGNPRACLHPSLNVSFGQPSGLKSDDWGQWAMFPLRSWLGIGGLRHTYAQPLPPVWVWLFGGAGLGEWSAKWRPKLCSFTLEIFRIDLFFLGRGPASIRHTSLEIRHAEIPGGHTGATDRRLVGTSWEIIGKIPD